MKLRRFRRGGVHPRDEKYLSADKPLLSVAMPQRVTLLLSQNIGAVSKPTVRPGDEVAAGQMIAEAGGFVGTPLHSPVSGMVKAIEQVRDISGYWRDAIVIEPKEDAVDEVGRSFFLELLPEQLEKALNEADPKEIIGRIGAAGIVGLGGAAFPTRVKLTIPEGKRVEYLLINGAECEPYLTCDDTLMQLRPTDIIAGALLMAKACGARTIIIGIEANKKAALARMKDAAASMSKVAAAINRSISVEPMRTRYPQGSEKQLIQALTRRIVPAGGLPADAGCVVDNVATAFAAMQAVMFGRPLTHRIVTVTGKSVANPGNYIVANGSSYRDVIAAAGGLPEDTGKVLSGGPMMGRAMSNVDAPVVKATGGITILRDDDSHRRAERPCIRCARCVQACPMGLEPYLLMTLSEMHLQQESEQHGVMNCLECGCCSYICPSNRPLLDAIRLSKSIIRKKK